MFVSFIIQKQLIWKYNSDVAGLMKTKDALNDSIYNLITFTH